MNENEQKQNYTSGVGVTITGLMAFGPFLSIVPLIVHLYTDFEGGGLADTLLALSIFACIGAGAIQMVLTLLHAAKSPNTSLAMWLIGYFFMTPLFVTPAYWFLYIFMPYRTLKRERALAHA